LASLYVRMNFSGETIALVTAQWENVIGNSELQIAHSNQIDKFILFLIDLFMLQWQTK